MPPGRPLADCGRTRGVLLHIVVRKNLPNYSKERNAIEKSSKKAKTSRGKKSGSAPLNPFIAKMVNRNEPVVEEGFRLVGPAQAMMDWGKPIFESCAENKESMNDAMSFLQMCWNIAVMNDGAAKDKAKLSFMRQFGKSDLAAHVDYLLERHKLMFPTLKKDTSFYLRERVIDEPTEKDKKYFNEQAVRLNEEIFGPGWTDRKIARRLTKLDGLVQSGEAGSRKYDKQFVRLADDLIDRFDDWCRKKGVTEEQAGHLTFAANRFLDFLYRYVGRPLNAADESAFSEFMTTFWIRKTFADAESMTAMPMALHLFYRFLREKELVDDDALFQKYIQQLKPAFLANFKSYQNPAR